MQEHRFVDNNFKPKVGRGQEGGRNPALLPQKRRKFHSKRQVLSTLSEGFREPAYVPLHRFQLSVQKDGEHHPVYDFLATDPQTINKILDFAQEHGLAVLYQGTFFLRKETREQLRENRKTAQGDRQKIAQLDLQVLSGDKLVRLSYRVFIDIDYKDKDALWRLVKYLWKLKVYPEVWETQKGYHLYIYFYHTKEYGERRVKDEDGSERIERYERGYILPYTNDYRIRDIEESLKALCSKLGIKADITWAS